MYSLIHLKHISSQMWQFVPVISVLELKREDCCKVKVSLGCIEGSRVV